MFSYTSNIDQMRNEAVMISGEIFWSSGQNYNEGDVVNYEGLQYIALRWNINEVPLLCVTGAWEEYQKHPGYRSVGSRIGFESDGGSYYSAPVVDKAFLDYQYEQDIKNVLKDFSFKKIKAFNISEDKVCTRLLLPSIGDEETHLEWESNSPMHISNTGEICRPENGKDYPVWLKLTVSKGDFYASKVFDLWVCAKNKEIELNEEESVKLAFKELSFDDFKGTNTNILEIKENLNFFLEGKYGVKLAWLSMQKDYLKDDGTINRSQLSEDKVVKIHVAIRKGKVQMHKRFFLKLEKNDS